MGRNNKDFSSAMDGVGPAEKAWLGGEITDDAAYEATKSKKRSPMTVKQNPKTKDWGPVQE